MTALVLFLGAVLGEPRILSIRTETVGRRPAVTVVTSEAPTSVSVHRDGPDLMVSLGAHAPRLFAAHSPPAPIEFVRVEARHAQTSLRVRVPPDVHYEIQREPARLRLVFGPAAEESAVADVAPVPRPAPATPLVLPPIATPEPQPTPTSEPMPTPDPRPMPTPQLTPELQPTPEPMPTPEPEPEPTPEPQPTPTPEPMPTPELTPELQPTPEPVARVPEAAVAPVPVTPSPSPAGPDAAAPPASPPLQAPSRPVPERSATQALPDVEDLYRSVFPPPLAHEAGGGGGEQGGITGDQVSRAEEEGRTDVRLGGLSLRPSLNVVYAAADLSVEEAQPIQDQYLQVSPRIASQVEVGPGKLSVGHEMRLRRESEFEIVGTTTHLTDASLELPVGTRVQLTLSDHYARGTLETTEVDPGREYFFELGRFTRNQASAAARVDLSARMDLSFGVSRNQVDVASESGFFDHRVDNARAGLHIDVSPRLQMGLAYGYEHVPAPEDRPVVESRAHSWQVSLDGDILPLVSGQVSVGYTNRRSLAPGTENPGFSGLVFAGVLNKEFTRATNLRLLAGRSTLVSAFEDNPFYIATSGQAELTTGLPWAFSMRLGAGYHWNQYRSDASAIGRPREDRIFGWSAGLGRPITRWGYLRADYREERRDSNLAALTTESRAFTIELGVGLFPPARQ